MSNFEHKMLVERISELNRPPVEQTEFAAWIAADKHLDLLVENAKEEEVIIYACGKHTFIHAVVLSEERLEPPDIDDLLGWNGNPFASAASYVWGGGRNDVWVERGSPIHGSEALEAARALVFARQIPGLPGAATQYFEVAQDYSHLSEAHYLPEHSSYCRFDERGDLEKIVTVSSKTPDDDDLSVVTFKREPLEEYFATSSSALVRMFDFTLLRYGEFGGWPDGPEELTSQKTLFFRQKIDPGKAAYTRGVQLIRPSRPSAEIFSGIKRYPTEADTTQYVDFVAYDFRNRCVRDISTDPRATTNYFRWEGNSLPFETSPAFFAPEVLSRFKSDSEKYTIEDRHLYCRDTWELRGYDVNEAGQIHAYICDLRDLPYQEQHYWKSFNEEPKAGISERARRNDFHGEWFDGANSLERVKQILSQWKQLDVPWWKLRDPTSISRVTMPLTSSRDEWADSFANLAQLVIEGFSVRAIRSKLEQRGTPWESTQKSLALLELLLSGADASNGENSLRGLRLVQRIRSKVGAHVRGREAIELARGAIEDYGGYAAHFESVCSSIVEELEHIERAFGRESANGQEGSRVRPSSGEASEATA